mgnify:CR=1 FL=1
MMLDFVDVKTYFLDTLEINSIFLNEPLHRVMFEENVLLVQATVLMVSNELDKRVIYLKVSLFHNYVDDEDKQTYVFEFLDKEIYRSLAIDNEFHLHEMNSEKRSYTMLLGMYYEIHININLYVVLNY